MCLDGEKFEHHRIGDNLGVEKYSYKNPNGNVIMEKEYIKDLGVYTVADIIHATLLFWLYLEREIKKL